MKEKKRTRRRLLGISYGRVSTINQMMDSGGRIREDASPTAQKIRCEDHTHYLSRKAGVEYKIQEHISDEGFSAKNVNRPGYKKMWSMISSGKVNFVIASELSRLSRSVHDFLELVQHCKENEVDLIIIGLDLDTSSPFGRVIVIILVALAQFEREMTSLRVKENALARLLNDGKINGVAEILGLDRDPERRGHFKPNEKELKKVEELFQFFIEVPSKNALLVRAEKLGIKGKKGTPLTPHAIRAILYNSKWRYKGLWPANRENQYKDQEFLDDNKKYQIVKLDHGPLIKEELLDRVQEKLKSVYETKKRSGLNNHVYLLSGLLQATDKSRYHGVSAKKGTYRYYYNKKANILLECEKYDNLIRKEVVKYFTSDGGFQKKIKKVYKELYKKIPEINKRIDEKKKELLKNTAEQEYLGDTFKGKKLDNPFYRRWLEEEVVRLTSDQQKIEKELSIAENQKAEIQNKRMLKEYNEDLDSFLSDNFKKLSPTIQKDIIEKVIYKITLTNRNHSEIGFQPICKDAVTSSGDNYMESLVNSVLNEDTILDSEIDGGRDGT